MRCSIRTLLKRISSNHFECLVQFVVVVVHFSPQNKTENSLKLYRKVYQLIRLQSTRNVGLKTIYKSKSDF